MQPVSITLNFASVALAHEALAKLAAEPIYATIAHMDRPDVGADVKLTPIVAGPPDPSNVFGATNVAGTTEVRNFPDTGTVVPNPPQTGGAPSTVGVAAPPSAPEVQPVSSAAPASVFAPPAPTSGSVAAAPSAPAAPTNLASGVALDSKGLPWDNRIHGSTKSMNADGSWRQKRNLDEAVKVQVEAELRQAMAARAPNTVAPALPPTTAPSPAAASAPQATTAPAPGTGETFGQLIARIAVPMNTDPAYAALITQALSTLGLTAIGQLAARPDLVAPFSDTLQALVAVPA